MVAPLDITKSFLDHRERAFLVGDHASYRAQLSRQLKTLRKRLGRATPKNAKFTQKEITAEDVGGNKDFANLIILTAERAWAHAMLMKSARSDDASSTAPNSKLPGSTRTHIVSRLNKAAKHADLLASLLAQPAAKPAGNDWLEARAYAAYLRGAAELEKHAASARLQDKQAQRERWADCLGELATARTVYAALLKGTKADHFKDVISQEIDPAMRVAAYQSIIPRTVPVTQVAKKYFPDEDEEDLVKAIEKMDKNAFKEEGDGEGEGAGGLPTTITWRSRKANLVDASIGQALAGVQTAEERLTELLAKEGDKSSPKSRAAAYDEVLIAAQDAVDATRHSIDDHEKERISESDSKMQDLRITSLAVNYDMIGWRVGRNRVLIGEADGIELEAAPIKQLKHSAKASPETVTKPEGRGRKLAKLRERAVLYDAILQSIDSVKELRGAQRDGEFIAELDAKRAYFQALKCLNVAYSHAILDNLPNTLALLVRAESLSSASLKNSASSASSSTTPLKLDIEPSTLRNLQTVLRLKVHQHRALIDLSNATTTSDKSASASAAAPAILKLNEYAPNGLDLKNLVSYPPKLQPVPVKPLFFDLAWNYIEYPGQEGVKKTVQEKTQEAGEEGKKPAKKGWFGFGGR